MNAWDAVGFLASGLVITAFCMKDILHLRIVAVASNVAFMRRNPLLDVQATSPMARESGSVE